MAASLRVSHAEAQATPASRVGSVVPNPVAGGPRYPLVFAIALAGVIPDAATARPTRWIPGTGSPSYRAHQLHEITGGAFPA